MNGAQIFETAVIIPKWTASPPDFVISSSLLSTSPEIFFAFKKKTINMNKYLLHGKLTAKPDFADQLAGILIDASKLVSTAKGCNLYLINKDKDDVSSIWITEVWDSKEDHDNSLKDESVRELISKAIPILDGPPQKGQELEVLGGIGL